MLSKKLIILIFFSFFLVSVSADYLFRNGDFESELNSNDWHFSYHGSNTCQAVSAGWDNNGVGYHGFKSLKFRLYRDICNSAYFDIVSKTFLEKFTPYYFYAELPSVSGASYYRVYDCDVNFLNDYNIGLHCSLKSSSTSTSWAKYSEVKDKDGYILVEFYTYGDIYDGRIDFFNYVLEGGTFPLSNNNLTHTPEPVSFGETLVFNTKDVNTLSILKCGSVDVNSFNECVSTSYSLNPSCEMTFNYASDKNFQCKVYTDDGRESTTIYNYVNYAGDSGNYTPSGNVPVALFVSYSPDKYLREHTKAEPSTFSPFLDNTSKGFVKIINNATGQSFIVPTCNLKSDCILYLPAETSFSVEYYDSQYHMLNQMSFTTWNINDLQYFYFVLPISFFRVYVDGLDSQSFKCVNNYDGRIDSELYYSVSNNFYSSYNCLYSKNLDSSKKYFLPSFKVKNYASAISDNISFSNREYVKPKFCYYKNSSQNCKTINNYSDNILIKPSELADITIYDSSFLSYSINSGINGDYFSSSPNILKTYNFAYLFNNVVNCSFKAYPSNRQNIIFVKYDLIDSNNHIVSSYTDNSQIDYYYSPDGIPLTHTFNIDLNYDTYYCTAVFSQQDGALSSHSEFEKVVRLADENGLLVFHVLDNEGNDATNYISYNDNNGVIHLESGLMNQDYNLFVSKNVSVPAGTYYLSWHNNLKNTNNERMINLDLNSVLDVYIYVDTDLTSYAPTTKLFYFNQGDINPYLTCMGSVFDRDYDLNYVEIKVYDSNHTASNPNYFFYTGMDISEKQDLYNRGVALIPDIFNLQFDLSQCSVNNECSTTIEFYPYNLDFTDYNLTCKLLAKDSENHESSTELKTNYTPTSVYSVIDCEAYHYQALDLSQKENIVYSENQPVPVSCKICYTNVLNPLKNIKVHYKNSDLNYMTYKKLSDFTYCEYYESAFSFSAGTYSNERIDINSILGATSAIISPFRVASEGEIQQQYLNEYQQYISMCNANVGATGSSYVSKCTSSLCSFFSNSFKNLTCFMWGIFFFAINNFVGFIVSSFILIIFIAFIWIIFFRR